MINNCFKSLSLAALIVTMALSQAAAQQLAGRFDVTDLAIQTGNGPQHFKVELAITPAQHAQGLMFRQTLAPDAGMLFLYEAPQIVDMWMKNTYLPLDMIFIAQDGAISRIVERTVPRSLSTISGGGAVRAVLEVAGGTVARLGIKPGDRVQSAALPASPP